MNQLGDHREPYAGGQQREVLPEIYGRYFLMDSAVHLVPIANMKPTKPPESQPESVARAEKLMRLAARGEVERRAPIALKRRPDRTYVVLDGNATFGAASRYGWYALPAHVDD